MAEELTGPGRTAIVILYMGCQVIFYVFIFISETQAAFNPGQRGFFLWWAAVRRDAELGRALERETERLALRGTCAPPHPQQKLGEYDKE